MAAFSSSSVIISRITACNRPAAAPTHSTTRGIATAQTTQSIRTAPPTLLTQSAALGALECSSVDLTRAVWQRGGCSDAFAATPSGLHVGARTSSAKAGRRMAPVARVEKKREQLESGWGDRRDAVKDGAAEGRGGASKCQQHQQRAPCVAGSRPDSTRARSSASPAVPESSRHSWDVLGLGQAMVDFAAMVDNSFLQDLRLEKGARTLVDHEQRGRVLQRLDGCSYKVSAGGSLSNTLVALARLGRASAGNGGGGKSAVDSSLRVAMTGSVGSDPLGEFYRTKLRRANVHFLSKPISGGTTGTVVVLTTPDAQRTMLAYQGMSSVVSCDAALSAAVARARMLVVEGYLWDLPCTVDAIADACHAAKENGALVALTGSDVTCIVRHRPQFWHVMSQSADILFANADEARALLNAPASTCPAWAALQLSRFCPLVSVTDGSKGAYIAHRGGSKVTFVPSAPCQAVDTCGAGDAYAAGLLYGVLASEREEGTGGARASGRDGNGSVAGMGASSSSSSACPIGSVQEYLGMESTSLFSSQDMPIPADNAWEGEVPPSLQAANAMLTGVDARVVGEFAAQVAAVVVSQQGARLGEDAAGQLVGWWNTRKVEGAKASGRLVEGDLVLE